MGSLVRGGVSYTHNGYGSAATDVQFLAGDSGLVSKDVNSAILELATILKNSVAQFAYHNYQYTGANNQTVMEFLKETLIDASRSIGGFHLFYLTVAEDKHYIGLTMTADTKCSFDLRSVENPSVAYYGSFDNMSTGSADSFKMYAVTTDGEELFSKPEFTL